MKDSDPKVKKALDELSDLYKQKIKQDDDIGKKIADKRAEIKSLRQK